MRIVPLYSFLGTPALPHLSSLTYLALFHQETETERAPLSLPRAAIYVLRLRGCARPCLSRHADTVRLSRFCAAAAPRAGAPRQPPLPRSARSPRSADAPPPPPPPAPSWPSDSSADCLSANCLSADRLPADCPPSRGRPLVGRRGSCAPSRQFCLKLLSPAPPSAPPTPSTSATGS
eukprot:741476-Prorocentrum_minimum.AAC.1